MKCPNCGKENTDNAKFCSGCGKTLENELKIKRNRKFIIMALIVVIIVLLGVLVYASGILTSELDFETKNFEGFTIDVPVGSDYVLLNEHTTDSENILLAYWNKDDDTFIQTSGFLVGNNITESILKLNSIFIEQDGELSVYKNDSDGITTYKIFKKGGDANLMIMGSDLDAIKHMANSFKDNDFLKLATTQTNSSKSTTSSSTTAQSTESESWQAIGTYSGSGSGSESVHVPEGKIMVKLSAYPIKNYATNHLYVTSSTGDSGEVNWGSSSAVETRSDSFTFTSSGSETLDIEYYETVSWEVKIFKYQ